MTEDWIGPLLSVRTCICRRVGNMLIKSTPRPTKVIQKNYLEHCCSTPDHRHQRIELHLLWCLLIFFWIPEPGWDKWFMGFQCTSQGGITTAPWNVVDLGASKLANTYARVWHWLKHLEIEVSCTYNKRLWCQYSLNYPLAKKELGIDRSKTLPLWNGSVCTVLIWLIIIFIIWIYTLPFAHVAKVLLANLELQWINSFRSTQSSPLRPPLNVVDLFRRKKYFLKRSTCHL